MKNKIFLIFTMISLLLVSACSNTNNTNNPTINDANMALINSIISLENK